MEDTDDTVIIGYMVVSRNQWPAVLLLVILLLFLLLGSLRSAVVTAISIPVTTLGAFILMKAAGLSANLMTIGGLAIAIGIVVDGPIVVVENVVRRVRQSGNAPTTRTIVSATAEVARPILFSMLIILIVFVPLFTLDGQIERDHVRLAHLTVPDPSGTPAVTPTAEEQGP